MQPQSPRFPQGANVQVYIDANAGLTADEITAIKEGLEDWNSQPNNSQVTYSVTSTTTLPPLGTNNTIIVKYHDEYTTANGGADMTLHRVGNPPAIYAQLHFYKNIRTGNPAYHVNYVKTVAKHEGGHPIGLHTADDCPPGSTIMNPGLVTTEAARITDCDNNAVNTDPAYPPSGGGESGGGDGGGGGTCTYVGEGTIAIQNGYCEDYFLIKYWECSYGQHYTSEYQDSYCPGLND